MSDKAIACRCEDVSVRDIEDAVERGYRDLESVKRYTGFGTGVCQGKQCVAVCAKVIADAGGEITAPMTPRQPFHPVAFHLLPQLPRDGLSSSVPEPSHSPKRPAHCTASKADAVIVGGGIMGMATAYEMAQLGFKNMIVVEKGYLCSGASGRNGGGVRAQWSSEENISLMKESIALCRDFASTMRINVWFRQGGYLFLARESAGAETLAESVKLQNAHGVRTEMVSPKRAQDIVPVLNPSRLVAASYNPDDGVVFPWPFVWGYARACQERGVEVRSHCEVSDIETTAGAVSAVLTNQGRIETPLVINAAGAWSPEIAKFVDVELPTHPHRHEICSSEPLKPFLKPLVADLSTGLYFSQSMRGEIVGGIANPNVPGGINQQSSLDFLSLYASELTATAPRLGGIRVLRQWAGCYDISPDANPVIGPVEALKGFILMNGFMGHGFMVAPKMARIMARYLVKGEVHPLFEKWSLSRFAEGRLLQESMILG